MLDPTEEFLKDLSPPPEISFPKLSYPLEIQIQRSNSFDLWHLSFCIFNFRFTSFISLLSFSCLV